MKNAVLERIDTLDIFSKEGWKKVNKKCGHVSKDASSTELADGFLIFQDIWYEDNEIEYLDLDEPDKIQEQLVGRWSDYLLGD